jgi:hypothetical protein
LLVFSPAQGYATTTVINGNAVTTGSTFGGGTTLTFAQTGTYDYLLVPDGGGEAISVDYLLLPGLSAGEYISFDGTQTFTSLPGFATPYDFNGDNQFDYYDIFSFDEVLLPLPSTRYSTSTQTYTLSYQKQGSGYAYQFYSSSNGASWTAANMAMESYNAGTGFHQYTFTWNPSTGIPLFIRVSVTKP